MWIAISIIAVIGFAALIYLASLDGNYRVKRELDIDTPLDIVFDTVLNFKTWPDWSPWLMHEPGTRLIYSPNCESEGGFYTWDGKVVGAGKLTHTTIKTRSVIHQQIEFTRPFKSINTINWTFEAVGGKTRVGWEMVGRMPFLFRFMSKKMEPMIGRDYELGLAMLNGYLNADAPHPELSFDGGEVLDRFGYWSIPFRGNLRQLEAARRSGIEALEKAVSGNSGVPLCLYRRLDPMATEYQAEIAMPIINSATNSNYTRHDFTGGRYFKLTLRGNRRFVPLGWYALFSHCRMHRYKLDKSRPALEIYQSWPDRESIQTTLYLAIK